jgi:hypothetical protein
MEYPITDEEKIKALDEAIELVFLKYKDCVGNLTASALAEVRLDIALNRKEMKC